jgi:hypothetical protein
VRFTILLLSLVAGVGVLAAACAKRATEEPKALLHVEPCQEVTGSCQWETNHRFLAAVSRGLVPYAEDYDNALSYFESMTGIDANITGTWAGRPVDRVALETALERWISWCGSTRECPGALELWQPDTVVDPITGSLIE